MTFDHEWLIYWHGAVILACGNSWASCSISGFRYRRNSNLRTVERYAIAILFIYYLFESGTWPITRTNSNNSRKTNNWNYHYNISVIFRKKLTFWARIVRVRITTVRIWRSGFHHGTPAGDRCLIKVETHCRETAIAACGGEAGSTPGPSSLGLRGPLAGLPDSGMPGSIQLAGRDWSLFCSQG